MLNFESFLALLNALCCNFRFGQFISSTLPTFAVCEKFVVMEVNNEEKVDGGNTVTTHTILQTSQI